jgi:hypothetical protein
MGLMGLASNRVRSSAEGDAAKTPDDSVNVDLTSRKIVQYTLPGLKGILPRSGRLRRAGVNKTGVGPVPEERNQGSQAIYCLETIV